MPNQHRNTEMKDSEGYELKTYRVVWIAELGWCDGTEKGLWQTTDKSERFKTEEEAKKWMLAQDGVYYEDSPYFSQWRWKKSYGLARIRKFEEPC